MERRWIFCSKAVGPCLLQLLNQVLHLPASLTGPCRLDAAGLRCADAELAFDEWIKTGEGDIADAVQERRLQVRCTASAGHGC